MKVGIGYSNTQDARAAGQAVATAAIADGGLDQPSLVLAFCHGSVDHQAFYQGLRDILGSDIPIVGGSAIGVITNHHLSYQGAPAAAAVLQLQQAYCQLVSTDDIFKFPHSSGQRLARALQIQPKATCCCYCMIPSSFRRRAIMAVLNPSAPLLQGLTAHLPTQLQVAGAGLLGTTSLAIPGNLLASKCRPKRRSPW